MVLQPPHARVCARSESLEASSCVAQLEAQLTQLKELRQRQRIGVATGLLAQCFAITHERACVLAAHNADGENGCVATSRLRIVKDQP